MGITRGLLLFGKSINYKSFKNVDMKCSNDNKDKIQVSQLFHYNIKMNMSNLAKTFLENPTT